MASIASDNDVLRKSTSTTGETIPDLNIGTRKSKLALIQTDLVVDAMKRCSSKYGFTIKGRDAAAGDVDKVTPFKDMTVKNIWTHDLETLLMEGDLDILVHSLKDVPTQMPEGCEIGGVLERADPRDALVTKEGRPKCGIADLPAGAIVGTSSIRRTAQIALRFPHLKVLDVRGNVGTRLAKLDAEDGPFDAVILAAAGLHRLDLGDRISQYLDFKTARMLYAVGQGAIGIENMCQNSDVRTLVKQVTHQPTFLAITAERSLLRTLEGGCSAPLGVETEWQDSNPGSLLLRAIVVSINGKESAEVELTRTVQTTEEAEDFGIFAAEELRKNGAGRILEEIQAKKRTTTTDLLET